MLFKTVAHSLLISLFFLASSPLGFACETEQDETKTIASQLRIAAENQGHARDGINIAQLRDKIKNCVKNAGLKIDLESLLLDFEEGNWDGFFVKHKQLGQKMDLSLAAVVANSLAHEVAQGGSTAPCDPAAPPETLSHPPDLRILDLALFHRLESALIDPKFGTPDDSRLDTLKSEVSDLPKEAQNHPLLKLLQLAPLPLKDACNEDQLAILASLKQGDAYRSKDTSPLFEAQALYTRAFLNENGVCGAKLNAKQALSDYVRSNSLGFPHAGTRLSESFTRRHLKENPNKDESHPKLHSLMVFNDEQVKKEIAALIDKVRVDPLAYEAIQHLLGKESYGEALLLRGEGKKLIDIKQKLMNSPFFPEAQKETSRKDISSLRQKVESAEIAAQVEAQFFSPNESFNIKKHESSFDKNPLVDYYRMQLMPRGLEKDQIRKNLSMGLNPKNHPYSEEQKGLISLVKGHIANFHGDQQEVAALHYEQALERGVPLAAGKLAILTHHRGNTQASEKLFEAALLTSDPQAKTAYYNYFLQDNLVNVRHQNDVRREQEKLRTSIQLLRDLKVGKNDKDREGLQDKIEILNKRLNQLFSLESLEAMKVKLGSKELKERFQAARLEPKRAIEAKIDVLDQILIENNGPKPQRKPEELAKLENIRQGLLQELYHVKRDNFLRAYENAKRSYPNDKAVALKSACKDQIQSTTVMGKDAGVLKEEGLLECCDPRNRYWSKARVANWLAYDGPLDLFSWADQLPQENNGDDFHKGVHYLTPAQRETLKVSKTKKGLQIGNTPAQDSRYLYAIDDQGNLYLMDEALATAGVEFQGRVARFYHSSFFAGHNVNSAGMLEIKNGQIAFMDNFSGHYKPNKNELTRGAKALAQKGLITPGTEIKAFVPHRKVINGEEVEVMDEENINVFEGKKQSTK